jgi:membrane protein implicated in regulation of membrane protease activity
MSHAWIWAGAGLVLMVLEIAAPGVFMLWLGIAALITGGIAALIAISLELQLVTFSVAAVLSCVLGYLIYRRGAKAPRGHHAINDRSASMIGSTGEVAEAIHHGSGRVRVGDSLWLAEGPDLAVGTPVRIKGLSGNTLKVEAL